jgi:bacteriorhodopsin
MKSGHIYRINMTAGAKQLTALQEFAFIEEECTTLAVGAVECTSVRGNFYTIGIAGGLIVKTKVTGAEVQRTAGANTAMYIFLLCARKRFSELAYFFQHRYCHICNLKT